jgi:hydrogenase maturation protease
MRRVLVGTVGYHNLSDFSLGPKLLPRLQAGDWPSGVEVEELHWGPIMVVQHFQALPQPYERVVLVAARPSGRAVGTVTLRQWRGGLPAAQEIQERVSEAVTGIISLDNLLVVGEHFGIWPAEVLIVDVEPGPEEPGDTFTPAVEAAIPMVLDTVRRAATADLVTLEPLAELWGDRLEAAYG